MSKIKHLDDDPISSLKTLFLAKFKKFKGPFVLVIQ